MLRFHAYMHLCESAGVCSAVQLACISLAMSVLLFLSVTAWQGCTLPFCFVRASSAGAWDMQDSWMKTRCGLESAQDTDGL